MRKISVAAVLFGVFCFSPAPVMGAEKTILIEGKFYSKTANGSYVPCVECNLANAPATVSNAVCAPCQSVSSTFQNLASGCSASSSGNLQLGLCGGTRPLRGIFSRLFSVFSCR